MVYSLLLCRVLIFNLGKYFLNKLWCCQCWTAINIGGFFKMCLNIWVICLCVLKTETDSGFFFPALQSFLPLPFVLIWFSVCNIFFFSTVVALLAYTADFLFYLFNISEFSLNIQPEHSLRRSDISWGATPSMRFWDPPQYICDKT